jgi:hypothetical protein
MKLRHAAALAIRCAIRWLCVFMFVVLPAISCVGLVLTAIVEYINGERMADTLASALVRLITLSIGLAVCFGRYPGKST